MDRIDGAGKWGWQVRHGLHGVVILALTGLTGLGGIAWGLALGALVWGLRLMLHRGEDRVMRAVFLPIAVALGSVYCASLVPPPGWQDPLTA